MLGLPEAIVLAGAMIAIGMVLSAWILGRSLAAKTVPSQAAMLSFPSFSSLPPEASPVEPSGIPINAHTRLEIGTPLLANWNGLWWRAQVIDLQSDGQVRIHYTGWDSSWDETLPRERLQMDISGSVGG